MQRYFISPQALGSHEASIIGDDAYHLIRVMRVAPGEQVIVCDGVNRECLAEVTALGKDEVKLRIMEERPPRGEPRTAVWIAQSLPKGDKLETVIQKGTEIGASAFIPFISARTVVHYDKNKEVKRLERWRKIAKEAAEQAHRSRMPTIQETASWQALLALAQEAQVAFFCYEKAAEQSFSAGLNERLTQASVDASESPFTGPILIVIGPEGGFTEQEAEQAKAAGCIPVSLGQRILRTETAGLVALSSLMFATGEL